jgi:hypothetical protein
MSYDEQRVAQLIAAAEKALAGLRAALISSPHVPEPVSPGTDAVDLAKATITNGSPDVRGWPIGATLTAISLSADRNMTIDFTKRYGPTAWPFVDGPEGGDLQYTLWIGCAIGSRWHFAACIHCISRSETDNYVPTGPVLAPPQLPTNWYYHAGEPLASYRPTPGEKVAWFLTSGAQRRGDRHVITERTNVVVTPFSEGTYP